MKFIYWILLGIFVSHQISYAQIQNNLEEKNFDSEIRNVLSNQVIDWNNGDIEKYMQGYWENDSLRFIGKNGINFGWKNTLNNYKKSYPDKESMGILTFDILSVELLSENTAFVTGKWKIERNIGNINGFFTLLFRKFNSKWVVICDHSS